MNHASMMDANGVTHVGRVRSHNEDSFLVDVPLGMLVVADGMGGHAGGAIASRLAVGLIANGIKESLGSHPTSNELLMTVRTSISRAHSQIRERAGEEPLLQGMGTTLVVAIVFGEEVLLAHVGDSRAYLICNGSLHRLTEDHSLVARLLRIGEITDAEARTHPQRHIITQALGVGEDVSPGLIRFHPRQGDVLVLCTDGLHGSLDDRQILGHARRTQSVKLICESLIHDALTAGGEDNITVIAARWSGTRRWWHTLYHSFVSNMRRRGSLWSQ